MGILKILELENETKTKALNTYSIFDHYVQESPEINKALEICGWCALDFFSDFPKKNKDLNRVIDDLIKKEDFNRAVAISIFHFDFKKGLISINFPSFNFEFFFS